MRMEVKPVYPTPTYPVAAAPVYPTPAPTIAPFYAAPAPGAGTLFIVFVFGFIAGFAVAYYLCKAGYI
jgi:hypothetical protein